MTFFWYWARHTGHVNLRSDSASSSNVCKHVKWKTCEHDNNAFFFHVTSADVSDFECLCDVQMLLASPLPVAVGAVSSGAMRSRSKSLRQIGQSLCPRCTALK